MILHAFGVQVLATGLNVRRGVRLQVGFAAKQPAATQPQEPSLDTWQELPFDLGYDAGKAASWVS